MVNSMDILAVIIFIIVIIKVLFFDGKDRRKNKIKLMATVVEYRKESVKSMRKRSTKIDYPYVKINDEESTTLFCLRNASSFERYYGIGDQVEVYWDNDMLLPWN